ncbi:MAG: cupredoxin domain-containing protein [Actinomycetota bacterium]
MSVVTVPVMMGLLAPGAAQADHAATYNIQVGHEFFDQGLPAESMSFFPQRLTVHAGDTLNFVGGFHTATMIPANTEVLSWVDDNAGGIGKDWSFVTENPDGGEENPFKLNNRVFFPPQDCGPAANPCTYNGNDVVSSGALFFHFEGEGPPGFHATVSDALQPGDTFWVVCLIHPRMRMKVTVVDDSEATSTQAEIDAEAATAQAQDFDAASALHNRLLNKRTKRVVDGRVVWDAYAGFDTSRFSLFAMYPRVVRPRRGQTVRWHFDQLNFEDHTVTIPRRRGVQISNSEPILCDPDDGVEGDETEPDFSQGFPPSCPEGSEIELIVTANFAFEQGNGRWTGAGDFESSGVRGAQFESDPYDVRFTKPRKKAYKYVCMIHTNMVGRVKVRS